MMTSSNLSVHVSIKNGFFHIKITDLQVAPRVRSSSVPRSFKPEAFKVLQSTTPELQPRGNDKPIEDIDVEPPQLVKLTLPLTLQSLKKREAWADMNTDDEADTDDEDFLRTRSESTKCSTCDTEIGSMSGDAPSPASTCAMLSVKEKTALRLKATPFLPGKPRHTGKQSSKPQQAHKFPPRPEAFTALKLAAPWQSAPRGRT